MIWSIACMAKLKVMNSTIGLRPAIAAPTPTPAKPCSVIGVSITRCGAELLQQALGDLVGALILGDLLAHDEDVRRRGASPRPWRRAAPRARSSTPSRCRPGCRDRRRLRPSARPERQLRQLGARLPALRLPAARLRRWRRRFGCAAPWPTSPALFAFRSEHGDRRVDLHALGALGDQDLAERALVDGLDLHRRLVGLDLGDDVAGLRPCRLPSSAIWRALPSSIVGESAGIRISIGISSRSLTSTMSV